MQDSSISISKLITTSLWTIATLTLAASWVVWITGRASLAQMIGMTAVVLVGAAAVSQIRGYSLQICGLLRATRVEEYERPANLRPFR